MYAQNDMKGTTNGTCGGTFVTMKSHSTMRSWNMLARGLLQSLWFDNQGPKSMVIAACVFSEY